MNTNKIKEVLPSSQKVSKFIYKRYIDIIATLTLVMLFIMILQSFLICWVIPTIFIICIGLIKIHIFKENKDKMREEFRNNAYYIFSE